MWQNSLANKTLKCREKMFANKKSEPPLMNHERHHLISFGLIQVILQKN